jgi:hypothetical protein
MREPGDDEDDPQEASQNAAEPNEEQNDEHEAAPARTERTRAAGG